MKHFICFHLFNDYSGSPKILAMVIKGLLQRGCKIDLVTSRGGVLDFEEPRGALKTHYYKYNFSNNPFITILRYAGVQIYTFFFAFRYMFTPNTIFYINTLLPAGAALAGKIMGKKIIYHYHENAFAKGLSYKILCRLMQWLASDIICVSEYQKSFLKRKNKVHVVPNALPPAFCRNFSQYDNINIKNPKMVLMLSSLKLYKGTLEFIELSKRLPNYTFQLIINDTQDNIESFINNHRIQINNNLHIFSRQEDIASFYRQASLVVNLSNKEEFIETFGLTALEAMTAALPVIVPTAGGIAEMVKDGINGYKIDVQQLDDIALCIENIFSDDKLYRSLSFNAKNTSMQYSYESMIERITHIITAK